MIKGICAALVLGLSLSASAGEIVVNSPWIKIAKGDQQKDAKWATCLVTPDLISFDAWDFNQTTTLPAKLDDQALVNWIKEAKTAEWGMRALHVRATIPAVTISVGTGLDPATVIYIDSSDIQSRKGQAIENLIETAFEACGAFNP